MAEGDDTEDSPTPVKRRSKRRRTTATTAPSRATRSRNDGNGSEGGNDGGLRRGRAAERRRSGRTATTAAAAPSSPSPTDAKKKREDGGDDDPTTTTSAGRRRSTRERRSPKNLMDELIKRTKREEEERAAVATRRKVRVQRIKIEDEHDDKDEGDCEDARVASDDDTEEDFANMEEEDYDDEDDDYVISKSKRQSRKGRPTKRATVKKKGATRAKVSMRGKSKKGKNKGMNKSAKLRKYGPESERTCPLCKKVFSIITGLAYHMERKVCQKETLDRDRKGGRGTVGTKPFQILQPGDQFVTSYGVVEVVVDDRAPTDHGQTVVTAADKKASRTFRSRHDKSRDRQNRVRILNATNNRLRREKLMSLYLAQRQPGGSAMTQSDVWNLYCSSKSIPDLLKGTAGTGEMAGARKGMAAQDGNGGDKAGDAAAVAAQRHDGGGDPMIPRDSYPDRIVECVVVPDERRKFVGLKNDEGGNRWSKVESAMESVRRAREELERSSKRSSKSATERTKSGSRSSASATSVKTGGMRLYLTRRMLINKYNPSLSEWTCATCGKEFQSRDGLKFHINERVCMKRGESLAEERRERLLTVEDNMREEMWIPPIAPLGAAKPKLTGERKAIGGRKKKRVETRPWLAFDAERSSLYPEVFSSLVFRKGSNNSQWIGRRRLENPPGKRKRKRDRCIPKEVATLGCDLGMYCDVFDHLLYARPPFCLNKRREPSPRVEEVKSLGDNSGERPRHSKRVRKSVSFLGDFQKSEGDDDGDKDPTKMYVNDDDDGDFEPTADADDDNDYEARVQGPKTKQTKENPALDDERPKKRKRRRRLSAPVANPRPQIIVDVAPLIKEIDSGRYPSMKKFIGEHDTFCAICKREGQLHHCKFCSTANHMKCLQSKQKLQETEPGDDFMCHRCIGKILARRVRAEKRRLQKCKEALAKAGMVEAAPEAGATAAHVAAAPVLNMADASAINLPLQGNSTTAGSLSACTNSPPAAPLSEVPAVAIVSREVDLMQGKLDAHVPSYEPCPNGGPGGLICCASCSASYSRFLSNTSKEMEAQTVAKVGQEVSEIMELLMDAKHRLRQAVDISRTNGVRRSLLHADEVGANSSNMALAHAVGNGGTATAGAMRFVDNGSQH